MQESLKIKKLNNETKFLKKKKFDVNKFIKIYGIGKNRIFSFYNKFGLNRRVRLIKVKYRIFKNINLLINKLTFRNTLQNKLLNIRKFTIESLRNYKGIRHSLRYPVRGQRTHTNAKTRKRLKTKDICNLT